MKYLQDILQQFKSKCLAMINKNREDFQYTSDEYLSPYQSAKNKFKKGNYKICRTFSYLQNSGSSQLPIDDTRWKNFMRYI